MATAVRCRPLPPRIIDTTPACVQRASAVVQFRSGLLSHWERR